MLISGLNNGLGPPTNSDQTNQNGRISAAFLPASLVVSLASQQQRQFVKQQDIVPACPTMVLTGMLLQFPLVPPRNQSQPHPPQQPAMNMNTNFHLSFGQENGRASLALAFHQPTSFFRPSLATTPFGNDLSSFTNLHWNEMRIRFQQQQQSQQNQLFQLH